MYTYRLARNYEKTLEGFVRNYLRDSRRFLKQKIGREPDLLETFMVKLRVQLTGAQRRWTGYAIDHVKAILQNEAVEADAVGPESPGTPNVPPPAPGELEAVGSERSTPTEPFLRSRLDSPPARKGRRKPDFERAARIARAVARIAPNGQWHSKVDEILEALDEESDPLPIPRPWHERSDRSNYKWKIWSDCDEPRIAIKLIEYYLKRHRERTMN